MTNRCSDLAGIRAATAEHRAPAAMFRTVLQMQSIYLTAPNEPTHAPILEQIEAPRVNAPLPPEFNQCCYPIGEPRTPGFRYCAAPVAQPGASERLHGEHMRLCHVRWD